jgi:hypothetical protein
MSIAIISSLYRIEAHLERFTQAVLTFAEQVHEAGIAVHYLPILNDATPLERDSINQLASQINDVGYGNMSPQYVERETLYASWNRGISLTDAPYFTFWNADDIRDADAFIEGYRALENGANLVDFIFTGVKSVKRFGVFPIERNEQSAMLFNPEQFTRKNGVGPFFMASKALYEQVGEFDENFRIAGDMQWAGRTLPTVQFYPAKKIGGYFYIHGDNLSNTGTSREVIEVNIIFMRRQDWHYLLPANPRDLRDAWENWGTLDNKPIPDEVAEFLWGDDAETRWKQFQAERNQVAWLRRIRRTLAARGLIKSVEWSVYLWNRMLADKYAHHNSTPNTRK